MSPKITRLAVLCLPSSLGLAVAMISPTLAADESIGSPDGASIFDLSITDLMATKVTAASLFDESELDTAASVSVLRSEDWEQTGARRLSDALESVPAVASYPTWGGAEAIAIRGYATELSVRGISNTLNGVPLNGYVYATSLYDKPILNLDHLNRVEVIRGPGSTLYGSDAFHGVIARELKTSAFNTVSVDARGSDSEFADASVFVSQGLGDLRVNAGVAIQEQGEQDLPYTYTDPFSGVSSDSERDYKYRDLSGHATLIYEASDDTAIKLTAYASDYEADEFPGTGTQFFARIPASFDVQSTSLTQDKEHSDQDSDFWLGAIDVSQNLGDSLTLEAKLYHWSSRQEWEFDNRRYPTSLTTLTSFTLPCRNATNASPNPIYCPHALFQANDERRNGLHVYLKSSQEHFNTQWAVGLGRDRLKSEATSFSRIALDGSTLVDQTNPYLGSKRTIDFALLQARTQLLERRLQLTYGVRFDDYSDVDTHVSPRLGAVIKVAPNYTTKLLYGHAFRAPTAIERQGSVQGVEANLDIEPEVIDTLEWVNIFYGEDYSIEATVFRNWWEDGIVLTPTTSTLNQYVNTGSNQSYGLEIAARTQIDQLGLEGSASYVKSDNEELDTEYVAFPSWLMTLQASYLFSEANLEVAIKQRAMIDYAEGDYLGTRRPDRADDYWRTDITFTQGFDRWKIANEQALYLSVYNLFDQDNVVPSLYNAEGGLADRGLSIDLGVRLGW